MHVFLSDIQFQEKVNKNKYIILLRCHGQNFSVYLMEEIICYWKIV